MERKPPFVIDYSHGPDRFTFALAGPKSWQEAEAHLASIRATAEVTGSDLIEIEARMMDQVIALADALMARLAVRGDVAKMMEPGAAMLAVAASLARGETDAAATQALAVRLLHEAGR